MINYLLLWLRNAWIEFRFIPLAEIPYQKWDFDSELDWTSPCSWNWRDPKGIYFLSPMIVKYGDPRDK